jgi:hypothetical protein
LSFLSPALTLITALAVAGCCCDQPPDQPPTPPPVPEWNHCLDDEYAVFSCALTLEPADVLSLCEAPVERPRTYLTVRRGPKGAPSLVFPAERVPPTSVFEWTTIGELGPKPEFFLELEDERGDTWRLHERAGRGARLRRNGTWVATCLYPNGTTGSVEHVSVFDEPRP